MVRGQRHAPAALYPSGKTRYPLYRRLAGPQGPCGQVRKISPPPGFDPRTVQPVASRYTDWAIPAHAFHSNTQELSQCVHRTGSHPGHLQDPLGKFNWKSWCWMRKIELCCVCILLLHCQFLYICICFFCVCFTICCRRSYLCDVYALKMAVEEGRIMYEFSF